MAMDPSQMGGPPPPMAGGPAGPPAAAGPPPMPMPMPAPTRKKRVIGKRLGKALRKMKKMGGKHRKGVKKKR